jgi:asparagine synthase (glutamine-hydrolysing)
MSVQFGIWNFDGRKLGPDRLGRVRTLLEPYAPDGVSVVERESLALLYGDFQTGRASRLQQPHGGRDQRWFLWDGRLDNRDDLRKETATLKQSSADLEIVAAAYERSGVGVFARLLGDWAVSICEETKQEIVLARDFIGTRPLFYRIDKNEVTWSTVFDPLVLLSESSPQLCESYLAGWLSFLPESHLTPYAGVFSVPPSSFVRVRKGNVLVQRYWNFEAVPPIRYRSDRQYEEHFLAVFREAVRRRMDSPNPILAELSGGMDSSSIVCVADSLSTSGNHQTPRIDTVTYYDAAEPNWDELPYAGKVEQKRGRTGHHIDIGPGSFSATERKPGGFSAVPTSPYGRSSAADSFSRLIAEGGYRVVLSGLGGDEILGGVPTPIPELADLLVRLRVLRFFRQSVLWAMVKRKPVIALWSTVIQQFLPQALRASERQNQKLSWLAKEFAERNKNDLVFRPPRTKLIGLLPSLQANLAGLDVLRRQLSCVPLDSHPAYEWRYPFLDRDLVSFCFSIPRKQMVRPHQRRSLMRRALAGTVPQEILERRRKAYVSRGLVKILCAEWSRLRHNSSLRSQELGIVDSEELENATRNAEQGHDVPILPLLRTVALEEWLRNLEDHRRISNDELYAKLRSQREVHASAQELLGRER